MVFRDREEGSVYLAGGTLHYRVMGDIDRVQGSVYMVWALLHYRVMGGVAIEMRVVFK